MINLCKLSEDQSYMLKLAYDEYEKLTKMHPLHVCDSDEYYGKNEFTFLFRYNPQIVTDFKRTFFGLCIYDKAKTRWHVPAAWFTKDRVRNFCNRHRIITTGRAEYALNDLPSEMPENAKEYSKWYIMTPSEWRNPSKSPKST